MSGKPIFSVGDTYGALTIIEDTGRRGNGGQVYWKCKCECGNTVIRSSDSIMHSIIQGFISSCGCKKSKAIGKREAFNPIRIDRARESLGQIDNTTIQGIDRKGKPNKNNTTGYLGVSKSKRIEDHNKPYRARIMLRGHEIGANFETLEEAAMYRKYLEAMYFEPIINKYNEGENKHE